MQGGGKADADRYEYLISYREGGTAELCVYRKMFQADPRLTVRTSPATTEEAMDAGDAHAQRVRDMLARRQYMPEGCVAMANIYVNEYECDRRHGVVQSNAEAYAMVTDLNPYLVGKQEGLHEPSSVLCEGNWPRIYVEDEPGADFPRETPRYE